MILMEQLLKLRMDYFIQQKNLNSIMNKYHLMKDYKKAKVVINKYKNNNE